MTTTTPVKERFSGVTVLPSLGDIATLRRVMRDGQYVGCVTGDDARGWKPWAVGVRSPLGAPTTFAGAVTVVAAHGEVTA